MRLATSRSSAARPASRRNDTGVISNSRSFAFTTLSRSFFSLLAETRTKRERVVYACVHLFHGPTGDRGHLPAKRGSGSLASRRERTSGSDAARARQRRCRVVRPPFFSSRAGQTPLPFRKMDDNFVIVPSRGATRRNVAPNKAPNKASEETLASSDDAVPFVFFRRFRV